MMVMSNHRAHAHYLSKSKNISKLIYELYGKKLVVQEERVGQCT